ncbi:MAG: cupredoxin domain-containing protein [Mycobacterium sp.]
MLAYHDSSSYPVSLPARVPAPARRPRARHRRATALALVVFSVLLGACGTPDAKTSPAVPAAVQPAAAVTVVIRNSAFIPASFTVPPGATVTVRNEDQVIHTVTADNRAFNTGNVSRGVTSTFTAPTRPGTYPFHCLFHNYETGALTVSQ